MSELCVLQRNHPTDIRASRHETVVGQASNAVELPSDHVHTAGDGAAKALILGFFQLAELVKLVLFQ